MSKRCGEISIECYSPERKRIRTVAPLYSQSASKIPEAKKHAAKLENLLQMKKSAEFPYSMDVAVELIQELKWFQAQKTEFSDSVFESLYGKVLNYVGMVIEQLKTLNDEDLPIKPLADAYQYLIELIIKHNDFCNYNGIICQFMVGNTDINGYVKPTDGRNDGEFLVTNSLEFSLISLPLISDLQASSFALHPDIGSKDQLRIRLVFAHNCLKHSVYAVLLDSRSYTNSGKKWIMDVFVKYLEKNTCIDKRNLAWSLLPLLCMQMAKAGQDVFTVIGNHLRIAIDDPPLLINTVSKVIGLASCARSGCLLPTAKCPPTYKCLICDCKTPYGMRSKYVSLSEWLPYWFIASGRQSENTSVGFMRSICRFINHAPLSDLKLKSSPFGQGIIRRLSSSNREIRLAAKDALMVYLNPLDTDTSDLTQIKLKNRSEAIELISQIAKELKHPAVIEETLELVAGGIGQCCRISESLTLGSTLSFLLGYYCSSNVFLRSVAMEQLLLIARKHDTSVANLLSMFTNQIVCTIADTLSLPSLKKFKQCVQLLEMSPEQFLQDHQSIVIPRLVILGDETAFNRMSEILRVPTPVLCVNQAASVFVKIFIMDDQAMQQAMARFVRLISMGSNLDENQIEVNIPSLIKSCSIKLLFNLILSLGEDDKIIRQRAKSALLTMNYIVNDNGNNSLCSDCSNSDNSDRISNNSNTSIDYLPNIAKANDDNLELAKFLSKHVLGVLAYTNEYLRIHSTSKGKALRSIGELSALLGPYSIMHISSIVSTLSPSLYEADTICDVLHSWNTLANASGHTSLLTCDQLNVLISPLITSFLLSEKSIQAEIALTLNSITKTHGKALKQNFASICPIPTNTALSNSYINLYEAGTSFSFEQRVAQLIVFLRSKDPTLLLCAAKELGQLLDQNEKQLFRWKAILLQDAEEDRKTADALTLFELVDSLKAACNTTYGKLKDMTISSCSEDLAIIGYVSGFGKTTRDMRSPLTELSRSLPNDLRDKGEQIEFVCTLIIDHLAPSFAFAPSPSMQTCAAYAIQELLRLVGFTKSVVDKDQGKKQHFNSRLRQRWFAFPEHIIDTIRPLLDSQYTVQSQNNRANIVDLETRVPCIARTSNYISWLRECTIEAIHALDNTSGILPLFKPCISAIKEGTSEMILFILPKLIYQCSLQSPKSIAFTILSQEMREALTNNDGNDDNGDALMPFGQRKQCKEAVIRFLDLFGRSLRLLQASRVSGKRSSRRDSQTNNKTTEENALNIIIESMPYHIASQAAASCGMYKHAILYTELSLREATFGKYPTLFQCVDDTTVANIQELYYNMGDSDGVAGAASCRQNWDPRHTILKNEIEGNWAHALIGHETLLRTQPSNLEYQTNWVRCLQGMGQWEGSWVVAKELHELHPDKRTGGKLSSACLAAAWRLGKWEWVESNVSKSTDSLGKTQGFDTDISALLSHMNSEGLSNIPILTMPNTSILFSRALHSAGSDSTRTHMLGDIRLLSSYAGRGLGIRSLEDLFDHWKARLSYLPPVYNVQEPVLSLHACLCKFLKNHYDDPKCAEAISKQHTLTQLQAAQLARLAGFHDTALGILSYAELTSAKAASNLVHVLRAEHAQILWDKGNKTDAMAEVKQVFKTLSKILSVGDDDGNDEGENELGLHHIQEDVAGSEIREAFAKASLLFSQWQEETNAVNASVLIRRYERTLRIHDSDRLYYALGHLYNNLFIIMSEKDTSRTSKSQQENRNLQLASLQYYIIRYYSRSIICSPRFLYQALPRLLTVWLDSGQNVLKPSDAKNARLVERFKTINRMIGSMTKRLPTYYFLSVLSQLVSRICHQNPEVFAVLESIILGILELYPQQTLWQLVGVQRSTYAERSERSQTILSKGRSRGVSKLIQQSTKLTDLLLGLCNSIPPSRSITNMSMSRDFKQLSRSAPFDLIVPLQSSLVPSLPAVTDGPESRLALSPSISTQSTDSAPVYSESQRAMLHQPFLADLPTVNAFDDEIEVMHSLQRPKKIIIIGSDGQTYRFLCKPKDDLRKDARLMEFNAMINRLLSSNTQTQKRGLHIRTYAVVPLNEECGLIQWVGSTTGIRHILLKLYKAHGIPISMSQVKKILDQTKPSPEEIFTKTLLPMFPSVLHEWVLQTFGDPIMWFAGRSAFTRTAAVMSMVGHILGLGDRHCENILLDESSGDVVHVDFNCLFDKGMTLEKPEKVPFRLTHNMVDAMGITGYEGAFRKTCEMSLSLLRTHHDALMSVLESFIHDPLVEWSKRATRSNRSSLSKDASLPNEQAARCLYAIRKKLQGILQGIAPLSVEGQVDELIREATDPKRLFQMYIGWAAYM